MNNKINQGLSQPTLFTYLFAPNNFDALVAVVNFLNGQENKKNKII